MVRVDSSSNCENKVEEVSLIMKSTKENSILLVIPLWNEESRGSFPYLRSLTELKQIDFIFVNDGSSDNTWAELKTFTEKSNVRIINLPKNVGKTKAVKSGILHGIEKESYDVIGYLDGDGAFSIDEVVRCALLAVEKIKIHNYDVFCTSRVALSGRDIVRRQSRHFIGRGVRSVLDIKHKKLPYDTQSGFKLFSNNKYLHSTMKQDFQTKWFVDLEILLNLRIQNPGLMIWEEPLNSWVDIEQSSISWRSTMQVIGELIYILRLK